MIGIPLAAGAFIGITGWTMNPMFGAAAMSLSSFFVVTNALRLNLLDVHNPSRDKKRTAKGTADVKDNKETKDIVFNDDDANIQNDPEEEKTMEKTMTIEGMMCMHCEARVKKALEAVDGVESADVSHEENRAVVTLNKEVPDEVLKEAVEAQDYVVKGIE